MFQKRVLEKVGELVYNILKRQGEEMMPNIELYKQKIEELNKIKMASKIRTKIESYIDKMDILLAVYNNGKNKWIFQEDNYELYCHIQSEFSDIIDLRYDISGGKIKTKNKHIIISLLDEIIELQRDIIEDINSVII